MTLSLHLQPVLLRGVWLLYPPLPSLHQTQLSGQSHQYFIINIYAKFLVCKLMRLLRLTPGLIWACKKFMRGQGWCGPQCRDLIRLCHLHCDNKTRHFLSGDHLSYLDASCSKPRARISEKLMSVSRWVSTHRRAPPRHCHTGDTRERPWCRHTGTLRTLKSGIFRILVCRVKSNHFNAHHHDPHRNEMTVIRANINVIGIVLVIFSHGFCHHLIYCLKFIALLPTHSMETIFVLSLWAANR